MSLNDFIENANELGVITLQPNQLKEVNGGIGEPVGKKSAFREYLEGPEFAYLSKYYEEVLEY